MTISEIVRTGLAGFVRRVAEVASPAEQMLPWRSALAVSFTAPS